eukprot:CAMPEP_0116135320 /NCGR_PEP_ID=MMETSP0329-20121206/11128_1 /TAXON_ID=697910 /ORGANISM="Pseudo-nitzschia arenysensis, Strain B593" /LENGTH=488 /DNA_ID=CAMNT_0003630113 /DNA_START=143 /DNA_END=1609 /DNA_ORIENTATION=+
MTDTNPGNDIPGGSGHETGDDNKRTAVLSYNEDDRKLRALAGQWKTPPMPIYASTAQPKQPAPAAISSSEKTSRLSAPANLPDNSEEYAKALQEAYRKGAEAAARMAQQQHQIPSAASCPNFSTGSSQQPQPTSSSPLPPSGEEATMAPVNTFQMDHQIHPPHQQHQMSTSIPDPLKSSMPPPLPPAAATSTIHHQHHPPQTQITYAPQHLAEQQTYLQPQQSQPQQYTQQQQQPQMAVAQTVAAAPRKRLKRLARNRASARLRRLRKKNLVDAYETEVGILEKTLKQLEAHEWGKDTDDHKALLDALGMERGQQAISPEERNTIIQDILTQQKQQVTMLQQAQREQEVLVMLASGGSTEVGEGKFDNSEEDLQMIAELQEILQLSDDQKAKLQESSKGLDREVEALETVSASLEAIQQNDWLLNEGVQEITDQFTSILHKNQQSKLLLWTDANAEAVDQLDLVQVQPLQSAPIFSFGVESTTPADDE